MRLYHLRVRNRKPWPPATGVQVFLVQIEEPGPGGALNETYRDEIPLPWKHQTLHTIARTIGHDADCGLFRVSQERWFSVMLIGYPVGFKFHQRREPFDGVVFTVQARAAEGNTAVKRLRVSWDGEWDRGEVEMSRHLQIQELPDET